MASAPSTIAVPPEIIPANYIAPLDFQAVFGNRFCLEVDLGCGDGSFLAAAAAANPARNFLGIERMPGRVRTACRKIEARGVTNARILQVEILYAVRRLLPTGSVKMFHLMFPDPWPKRRHWRHRVFTDGFLAAVNRALASDGLLRIATDEIEYFREIERLAARSSDFIRILDYESPATVSTFEKRFREDRREIHRLVLRKVSSSRNGVASQ